MEDIKDTNQREELVQQFEKQYNAGRENAERLADATLRGAK